MKLASAVSGGCRTARTAAVALPLASSRLQQQRHRPCQHPCSSGSRRLRLQRLGPAAAPFNSEDLPESDQPLASESPVLEVERQSERALAYAGIAALLGASGMLLAVAPTRAVEFLYSACPTLLVAGMVRAFGSILLLAAVCAYCLKEAAEKDLMRSDTYKRLNLGLFWWGLGTALAVWLAPQQPLRAALGLCTAVLLATSAHAALTYNETSEAGGGWNPLFLLRQCLSTLGNVGSYKNSPNTALYALYTYGLSAKAASAAVIAILWEGRLRLAKEGLLLSPLGTLGHTFLPLTGLGYALGAVVLYTLKDAAYRGRLGASTFRALNIGVAIVAITQGLNIYSWMQAGIVVKTKLAYFKVAAHAILAAVALFNYAFAKKKNAQHPALLQDP